MMSHIWNCVTIHKIVVKGAELIAMIEIQGQSVSFLTMDRVEGVLIIFLVDVIYA